MGGLSSTLVMITILTSRRHTINKFGDEIVGDMSTRHVILLNALLSKCGLISLFSLPCDVKANQIHLFTMLSNFAYVVTPCMCQHMVKERPRTLRPM